MNGALVIDMEGNLIFALGCRITITEEPAASPIQVMREERAGIQTRHTSPGRYSPNNRPQRTTGKRDRLARDANQSGRRIRIRPPQGSFASLFLFFRARSFIDKSSFLCYSRPHARFDKIPRNCRFRYRLPAGLLQRQ